MAEGRITKKLAFTSVQALAVRNGSHVEDIRDRAGLVSKVLVSLDDALLRRIDRRAAACGVLRSGYLAALAERDLAEIEGQGRNPATRRALGRLDRVPVGSPAADSTRLVRQARDAR
jgi:hypothetical protein